MKRIFPILLCVLFLAGCKPQETVILGFSMDASYRIETENLPEEQESEIKNYLYNIDTVLNVYQEDSVISKLNQTKLLTVSNSDEEMLFNVLQNTLPYCNETFDVSIRPISKLWDFKSESLALPTEADLSENLSSVGYQNVQISDDTIQLLNDAEIELGAVAKGYVCDQVAKMLAGKVALIDIGGTLKTIGKDITAGVKSPDHDGLLCSFTLSDGKAVSTSGSYERSFILDGKLYHHILDPKTGYPVETDFVSATVICDSAMEADILSTTLFSENSFQIPKNSDVIYVTKDNLVYISSGIKNFKLLNQAYQVNTIPKE